MLSLSGLHILSILRLDFEGTLTFGFCSTGRPQEQLWLYMLTFIAMYIFIYIIIRDWRCKKWSKSSSLRFNQKGWRRRFSTEVQKQQSKEQCLVRCKNWLIKAA